MCVLTMPFEKFSKVLYFEKDLQQNNPSPFILLPFNLKAMSVKACECYTLKFGIKNVENWIIE